MDAAAIGTAVSSPAKPLPGITKVSTITSHSAVMAEGCTNVGIGRRLFLTERTVETHIGSILSTLGLSLNDEQHRRVLAVLAYLGQH
jgi:DNA-binding NarL/FixJ family response regulator